MKKSFLFFSIMISFSLYSMSGEAQRRYLLRILNKGHLPKPVQLTPLQKRYYQAGAQKFITDVHNGLIPAEQLESVGALFVYAPRLHTEEFMEHFPDRALVMAELKRAALDKPGYAPAIHNLRQQFQKDSRSLVFLAVDTMRPDIAQQVFAEIPEVINESVRFYHGYGERHGTFLDYIESEQEEEFNTNRLIALHTIKTALLALGGKTAAQLRSERLSSEE